MSDGAKRRVAVSGAGGFLGSYLSAHLAAGGWDVVRIVRRAADPARGEVSLQTETCRVEAAALEGIEAVVHLAGEPITGRWTERKKQRILCSRTDGTWLLCEALARLKRPPAVLLCASAVGFYGHRDDDILDESAGLGSGFLAGVCQSWEAATAPAREAGIRTASLRLGMVLAREGGVLPRLLPMFRAGLGSVIGSGRQWVSWITREDAVRAICHIINGRLNGSLNLTAPTPVTQAEFTRALAAACGRPARLRVPSLAIEIMLGQMGREVLLASTRTVPQALLDDGFTFRHPEIAGALHDLLSPDSGRRGSAD